MPCDVSNFFIKSIDKTYMLCYIITVLIQIIQFGRGDTMIKLDYKNPKPLHMQISDGLKELIMCGAMLPDEQLPSVRDLSVELTVNPNTVQRAYKSLETEGVIYSIRGKGNFVAKSPDADRRTIDELYANFATVAKQLAFFGERRDTLDAVIEKVFEERVKMND